MDLVKILLVIFLLGYSSSSYVGQGTIFGQLDSEISHCGLHRSIYETPFHVGFNVYSNDYSNEVPVSPENQGFYNNGGNCGRWIKLTLGQHCVGTNGQSCSGTLVNDIWAGESINVIGYESCADQGLCRLDQNHLDISSSTIEEIGGQTLFSKWNYQTYCQNNPGFVISPEDALAVEGDLFRQKLVAGTLCSDPVNFKKTKDQLKQLGSVLRNKWNSRSISWDFIESPSYSGDILIYTSPFGNRWGEITLFSHLKQGISRVQKLVQGNVWRDGERCGLAGLCYFFQVDSGDPQTTIRIYDANGQRYPNQYTYIYEPNGTYRSLAYVASPIPEETNTPAPEPTPQVTTYVQATLPSVNFNDAAGFYSEMLTYGDKDWRSCQFPVEVLGTTYFASLARQNTGGTPTANVINAKGYIFTLKLPFPLSDDKVGAYNNGKNCGRWVKVVLGRQCEQMNWGDGCSNYIDDPYTGKQFYALVVDNCGAGDGFCGRNANAIQVSQSAVKQVGESIMMDWNNREVKWTFVKDPNSKPIKIYFTKGTNIWTLGLSIINAPNGISKVQRKVSQQWADAKRPDESGGFWLLPGQGSTRIFHIRAFDIDNVAFPNEYIFKFPCPMDPAKGYLSCTTATMEVVDLQVVAQGYQIPMYDLSVLPGYYSHLSYYDSRGWLSCGIPAKSIPTKFFASLARQRTTEDLKYPVSDDKVGMYNNGKNCGRWIKVTLGNQCEEKNQGSGCKEEYKDDFSGKSFYALVVDTCWSGETFCGSDPNALSVSADALKQTGDGVLTPWNNREVKWEFVDNPNTGPVSFYFGGGTSIWWMPFYAVNLQRGVSNIQRYVNGAWVDATRSGEQGGSWTLPGAGNADSFKIQVFDVNGQLYPQTYQFNFPCPLDANNNKVCATDTLVTLI